MRTISFFRNVVTLLGNELAETLTGNFPNTSNPKTFDSSVGKELVSKIFAD